MLNIVQFTLIECIYNFKII